jgi:hypothetical protein
VSKLNSCREKSAFTGGNAGFETPPNPLKPDRLTSGLAETVGARKLSERRGRVAVSGREAEITRAHAAANDGRNDAKLDRDQRLELAEHAEPGKQRPPKKLCSVCQNAVAAEYVWWIEDTAVAFVCSGCFGRPRPADPTPVRHDREWQITQEAPASLRSSFTSPGSCC